MAATALRELVAALTESGVAVELVGDGDPAIGSITEDSRVVSAGALFCALRGTVGDGHDIGPRGQGQFGVRGIGPVANLAHDLLGHLGGGEFERNPVGER